MGSDPSTCNTPMCVSTTTGQRNGAVLFKCSDGKSLWISHMKRAHNNKAGDNKHQLPPFKLPSTGALPDNVVASLPLLSPPPLYVPFGERPATFQEVTRALFWESQYA